MSTLGKYTRKRFDGRWPNCLSSHLGMHTVMQLAVDFLSYLAKRTSKHFMISCSIVTLSACSSGPLNQPCPENMERGDHGVCQPISSPPHFNKPPSVVGANPNAPDRQNPSEPPPPRCPEQPASVRVHEALIDPDGPDKGKEWIELRVETPGQLDGAFVQIRPSHLDDPTFKISLAGQVELDQIVLISDQHPNSTPFACDQTNGCLRNAGGVIELYSCEGELLHQLAWGSATATRVPVRSGLSLSWCEDQQTWASSLPTPGAPELEWRDERECPPPCTPPERLVFNEVLYDLVGADGGGEFIELITEPNTPIQGVWLHGINGSNGKSLFRPMRLEGESDAEGFFLIGGEEIEGRDVTLPTQLQNGPEALYLETCDGHWLDAMTYGGHTVFLEPYGEGSPVLPEGQSLGRYPDGESVYGTMEDYRALTPTPRAPNEPVELDEDGFEDEAPAN